MSCTCAVVAASLCLGCTPECRNYEALPVLLASSSFSLALDLSEKKAVYCLGCWSTCAMSQLIKGPVKPENLAEIKKKMRLAGEKESPVLNQGVNLSQVHLMGSTVICLH